MYVNPKKSNLDNRRRGYAVLVGIGLDDDGGHVRITSGDSLRIEGGSSETHDKMQEKAKEILMHLDRYGLSLKDITKEEAEKLSELVDRLSA